MTGERDDVLCALMAWQFAELAGKAQGWWFSTLDLGASIETLRTADALIQATGCARDETDVMAWVGVAIIHEEARLDLEAARERVLEAAKIPVDRTGWFEGVAIAVHDLRDAERRVEALRG